MNIDLSRFSIYGKDISCEASDIIHVNSPIPRHITVHDGKGARTTFHFQGGVETRGEVTHLLYKPTQPQYDIAGKDGKMIFETLTVWWD